MTPSSRAEAPVNRSFARSPLRVAHLIQYFEIGCLERMVERLCVSSTRRGVESLVIAYLGDGPVRAALERAGVRTVLLEEEPGFDPRLILRLKRILERERIDILHTHHLGPFIYGVPAAMLAGCARVHTEHSHELYDVARRRWLGASMSSLAEVVAVSPEVSEYRKRFPGHCRVIPNGVPLAQPSAALRARGRELIEVGDGELVVGCAARLSPEKDHRGLLEAFAQLDRQVGGLVLACAGDGPMLGVLRRHADDLGLGERVRWLGSIEDMDPFYASLDVCVLNSTREGLPLSLLEAMAFGVPVVATEVGGVGTLLADGAGVLVPPGDPTSLATELEKLLRDRALAASIGARGEARVRSRYDVEVMVDAYLEVYRDVVRRPVPPTDLESARCA